MHCYKIFLIIFVIKERFVFAEAGFLAKIKYDFLKTFYHKVRRKDFSLSFFHPHKIQGKMRNPVLEFYLVL